MSQPAWHTDAADLAAAVAEFEKSLPGWWWSVCACHVSRDATCGPTIVSPDADLLKCRMFDEGFSVDDDRPGSTVADALRQVMSTALDERKRARTDGRTCGQDCQCDAMQAVRALSALQGKDNTDG